MIETILTIFLENIFIPIFWFTSAKIQFVDLWSTRFVPVVSTKKYILKANWHKTQTKYRSKSQPKIGKIALSLFA